MMVLLTLRVHCLMSHESRRGGGGGGILNVNSSLSCKPKKVEEEGIVLSTLRIHCLMSYGTGSKGGLLSASRVHCLISYKSWRMAFAT